MSLSYFLHNLFPNVPQYSHARGISSLIVRLQEISCKLILKCLNHHHQAKQKQAGAELGEAQGLWKFFKILTTISNISLLEIISCVMEIQ